MSRTRCLLVTLLIALATGVLFSWPLPTMVAGGIASSGHGVENPPERAMIAGDHLQLLYQFWLFADMLRGRTPFWHNVYEFNTGADADRLFVDPYSVPFSLLYACGEAVGGRAAGWNFAAFISLWLTLWLTWALTRRYAGDDWLALCAAALAVVFPYRWLTLLGGSPTGFGMAYIPMVLLGLDLAVREDSMPGGFLAGAGILLCYFMDLHCFFFAALITPLWCVVALAGRERPLQWRTPAAWWRLARALLPVAAGALLAYVISLRLRHTFGGTDVAAGRDVLTVGRFSPQRDGLFSHAISGMSNHVFVGYFLPVALALGFLAWLPQLWRRRTPAILRRCLVLTLLTLLVAAVVSLALGMNGPWSGRLLLWCRHWIPPYRMIRQAVKAFVLLPSVLAALAALLLWRDGPPAPRALWLRRLAAVALLLAVAIEYRGQISPTICLLDRTQGAYEAVATDARARGETPRALAVPLWPGDSAWSSLYEYYASLYRIRMVNGYNPAVSTTYYTNVFLRLQLVNQGLLTDADVGALERMQVRHIVFHEDAFPEKVSPFPAAFTLRSLLEHPRLRLLRQDGPVWAFRIAPAGAPTHVAPPHGAPATWNTWCPAHRWEFEQVFTNAVSVKAGDAGAGAFARLPPGTMWHYRTRGPVRLPAGLHAMVRIRGRGAVAWTAAADDVAAPRVETRLDTDAWTWRMVPLPTGAGHGVLDLGLTIVSGTIDADTAYLGLGEWASPEIGQKVELPAALLFHAGYTKAAEGAVVLRRAREPDLPIVYGPYLPLEAGLYEVGVTFKTAAGDGVVLGALETCAPGGNVTLATAVSGRPCAGRLRRTHNLPVRVQFGYSRAADMTIERLTIRRIE